ncbi:hypothetical protein F4604DRAFT_1686755 [Suillus subluteus]|nr:hypothetical protein F4604DRAFT_1686755 [Suillus subluteus]
MNRENFCRATIPDGQLCDCEDFYARHGDEGCCAECGHGHSKHPRTRRTVDTERSETPQDEEVCPSSSGTAAVKEIFNHVTAKRGGSILSTKAAREEALSMLASTCLVNYSKLSKGPGPSTGLQKTWRDTTASSQPTRSQAKWNTASATSTFRVSSVGMIICSVDRHGVIRVSKAPSKNGLNEIQAMKNRGCYVDEQVTFHHDWSYSRITQLLCKLFPKVFDYLDVDRSRNVSSSAGQDEKLIWRLLNKSGQVLTVVNIVLNLAKHKGWDKASITESHLWFVTRNRIPDTVYESWNTQPIIAGSDSEGDGDSSELFSDIDSIRDDANHNPELASSLMEMDLSDSGDIHVDYKGKAKRTHTALSPDESPTNQRVAVKRLKSETASTIPHYLPFESPPSLSQLSVPGVPAPCPTFPELSYPVAIVSPQPNDPFAPVMVNPWESEYAIRPVHYLI